MDNNYSTIHLPIGADFWPRCARQVIHFFHEKNGSYAPHLSDTKGQASLFTTLDFSSLQVIVPAFAHAHALREALSKEVGCDFILPRINTVFGLLDLMPPDPQLPTPQNTSERLMELYAMLRQAETLRSVLGLHSQLDMLPLAQTILHLCDEMSAVLLPELMRQNIRIDDLDARWEAALKLLPPAAQSVLSEEASLVWTIWKAQADQSDPIQLQLQKLRSLAQMPKSLVWIAPVAPNPVEHDFLTQWQQHHPVQVLQLDWHASILPRELRLAWKMLADERTEVSPLHPTVSELKLQDVAIVHALSLEEEAQFAAQSIQGWILEGKQNIAVIAQDRVPARRLRALLERAGIDVRDETGWKVSTSLAAAGLHAWFELVAKRGDVVALLDLLKSPFSNLLKQVCTEHCNDVEQVPHWVEQTLIWLEEVLRRENIQEDWRVILHTCRQARAREEGAIECQTIAIKTIERLQQLARQLSGSRTLSEWAELCQNQLLSLGMVDAMKDDQAGSKIWQILNRVTKQTKKLEASFDFTEWRHLVLNEMDQASYKEERVNQRDSRVTMLPLNGARLRSFDAIWILGADAVHLPSQAPEFLFFANSIRAELGLATRESRQKQQMRDLAELLINHECVRMSYQSKIKGEENAASPWIDLLDLTLKLNGQRGLHRISPQLEASRHLPQLVTVPAPSAASLRPNEISATSAKN